ncbi:unnamed protein product [Prorocentrum cordatum]|uniref:Adenylate kinase isoenzyme 6 homolog n=1 Tax=Prorocentrum cordatum TaxID=2364126 RepID=A0ABN9WVF8_9DINO|nr:unnamed protein product [Polarella glacialis]
MAERGRPNVLVTGTPGVGKTTFCDGLAQATGLTHLEVGKLIREKQLYREWDDEMDCSIFDEELVLDALEPLLEEGGQIVDFHSSGFLQDDWFDLVVVLRVETETLYGRLERRHYGEAKIRENVEAEIFQTCLDEAREAFEDSDVRIMEIHHDTQEQLEAGICQVQEIRHRVLPDVNPAGPRADRLLAEPGGGCGTRRRSTAGIRAAVSRQSRESPRSFNLWEGTLLMSMPVPRRHSWVRLQLLFRADPGRSAETRVIGICLSLP